MEESIVVQNRPFGFYSTVASWPILRLLFLLFSFLTKCDGPHLQPDIDFYVRNFVVAYSKVYLEELEAVAEQYCPDDCNSIDEKTKQYVQREQSDLKNWAAYEVHAFEAHRHVGQYVVLAVYAGQCNQDYDTCVQKLYDVFPQPFFMIRSHWKSYFEDCLYELMYL